MIKITTQKHNTKQQIIQIITQKNNIKQKSHKAKKKSMSTPHHHTHH
jgi:hypothetical protein